MQLKAKGINFKYRNGRYILKDIDFEINSGEIVGLVAPSGFGKTTLAKILAGYEKPESGSVIIEGYKSEKNKYNPVQLIFQHPEKSVNPKWKMSKIINEAFEPSKELIDSMGIKDEWLNRWPSELSGGELQRFCVLRALSKDTKFLIADEMTTMLDAITQAQIWGVVLEHVKKYNIGMIVISHERALVDRICTRIVDLTEFAMHHDIYENGYYSKDKTHENSQDKEHIHLHTHNHGHLHDHINGMGHDHNHDNGITGSHIHEHEHIHEHDHNSGHGHTHTHAKS